jgi:hypothetical protein
MMTLTAGEVAKYIQRPKEPLAAAIARFRNWEKMGIIKPTGERHPGTGRKKKYSHEALLRAVILQMLTDAFGASAVSIAPSLGRLVQEFRGVAEGDTYLIVISHGPGDVESMNVVPADKLQSHILKSDRVAHTILNVPRMRERIQTGRTLL